MMKINQPYFILNISPWPILMAFNSFNLMISNIMIMNFKFNSIMMLNLMLMILIATLWWRDIIRESTFQGNHNFYIMNLIKLSMILFIISEMFLFISFFWNFLHNSLSPSIEIGLNWPPKNINFFNPLLIPLLNTIILLTSSFTITLTHFYLLNNLKNKSIMFMYLTIILSMYFVLLQALEYKQANFTFSDSIFGSSFYMATGFHGLHVIIGTIFLITNLMRMIKLHFSFIHHISFELSAWYWHFIDIIWLFLYMTFYWWNN
uniref:Cytochrome c oxidase subunit 3 n=2 Tax=Floraphis TaxID=509178 RepID=A0A1Z1MWR6_9HEMI|nr:cytochrome c oxidase subunit III [Floraphis choui]YP_009400313.1 cytochrome c oxidase subunit III [Floraphis meitanensis]ARW70237.1 cytochrome c oxidase subunit III [Floraphis choui]ARW70367.1 cytochrome c oxidase subunit III [Floraphis meitanensis]